MLLSLPSPLSDAKAWHIIGDRWKDRERKENERRREETGRRKKESTNQDQPLAQHFWSISDFEIKTKGKKSPGAKSSHRIASNAGVKNETKSLFTKQNKHQIQKQEQKGKEGLDRATNTHKGTMKDENITKKTII